MSDDIIKLSDGLCSLKEIKELSKKTAESLIKCEYATKIWNRSRSGMMLRNMTVGGEYSSLRQMRQVAAEIKMKHLAMIEAKYKILKRRKKAEIKREKANTESNKLKRDLLILEAEELESRAVMVEEPYIGAMREVVELSRLHDFLEKKIREEHGKFDEEVFELEESKYWVRRSFDQSLRDIRQFGNITVGNQELLEHIGFDPFVVKKMLIDFLKDNENRTDVNGQHILKFLDVCAEKFCNVSVARMKFLGLPYDVDNKHLLLEE